jgi:3-deoxy-D-manno-oct-2-ulosonic acid (Kdo) hydroxylase
MEPPNTVRSPQGWIQVHDFHYPDGYATPNAAARAEQYCRLLESGEVLLFRSVPFDIPANVHDVLFGSEHANTSVHKNVSFRPKTGELRGYQGENESVLRDFIAAYTERMHHFVDAFLSPYKGKYQLDFASFRPIEAQGRNMPLHKRDDLLHFDAFPSRPTRGGRILRIFTNLNPTEPRVWEIGEPFHATAPSYAENSDLRSRVNANAIRKFSDSLAAGVGVTKGKRSAYDRFMLRFHDLLKEDTQYQERTAKRRIEFPPNTTWLVYTDGVPHAVLSGRYALEQTFIVSPEAQVAPEVTPIHVLEKMYGRAMSA